MKSPFPQRSSHKYCIFGPIPGGFLLDVLGWQSTETAR